MLQVKFGQQLLNLVSARQGRNHKEAVSVAIAKISSAIPDAVANKTQLLSYLGAIKDKPALRLLKNMCETAETIEQAHQIKIKVLQQSTVAQSSEAVQSFFGRAAATSLSATDLRQLFDIWHSDSTLSCAAERLIAMVSQVAPHWCAVLLGEIAEELSNNCSSVPLTALGVIVGCAGDALQQDELQQPHLGQQLIEWCITPAPNSQGASMAARVICNARVDKEELLKQILEEVDLADAGDALPCVLATLIEIANSAADALIPAWPEVFSFLMEHVVQPKALHKCFPLALQLISKFSCMVPADHVVCISSQALEQLSPFLSHKSKRYHTIKAMLSMAQHPQIGALVGPQLFHQLAHCFEKNSVGSELIQSGDLYALLARGLHPHFSVLFTLCWSFSEEVQSKSKTQLMSFCKRLRAKLQVQSAENANNVTGTTISDCHPEAQLPYLVSSNGLV